MADHLANANLAGYDSHGFLRIHQYLKNIEDGELDPKAEPEVVGFPVGGIQGGHKGYALSVMVALFGALLGQIASPPGKIDLWAGSTILVIDLGRMAPLETIRAEVQQMMRYLQNTPLMEGSSGVL